MDLTLQIVPDAAAGAKANRAFLRRVVRYLAGQAGIGQFLDIGSGLPSQGNVHQIAREVSPAARVAYIDSDPVVLLHAEALLADAPSVRVVTADVRCPAQILDSAQVREFIDFDRPVGLLMLAILHHIRDEEDPAGIVARFREAAAPGSYLAISSFRMPGPGHPRDAAMTREVQDLFNAKLGTGLWREHEEILQWFGDWELLDPGLVPLPEWRPDVIGQATRSSTHYGFVGGVAAKP